jgi:2-hydroxy-6-oxonona-2,4-dienedioate hydrolase
MNKIYVDDVGSGFPLVLVHGYLGSSEMWCNQKEYFSKFCRVITPALPGFGESSKVKSLDTIEGMALKIIKVVYEKKNRKI